MMKTFLISYDLNRPEWMGDYVRLAEHIKSYGTWAKPLKSVWIIKTDRSAMDVMKGLQAVTDSNDKILVTEITNNWVTLNHSKEVNEWLRAQTQSFF